MISDRDRKKKKLEIGTVRRLRGIVQKQGVDFPEMEKKWFGGPQHLNSHIDRPGLYHTQAELDLELVTP